MSKRITENAKALRQRQTDAEKCLWQHIRNRKTQYKFRRQHPFPPYIADFYCDELKLVIELDGGQHADHVEYDQRRTRFFNKHGIIVLRFWNNDILQNIEGVMSTLTPALSQRERELRGITKSTTKMTTISLIVAMANNRVIGVDNTLPWRLSADLKRFKAMTMGKPIIMGRKTWDSIGRPLPGRLNIVITRNPDFTAQGASVVGSLDAAIALAAQENSEEIIIMGGANIYTQALDQVDKMYLTLIDLDIEGDAWFPEYDEQQWRVEKEERCHQEALAEHNQPAFDYRFVNLVRQS